VIDDLETWRQSEVSNCTYDNVVLKRSTKCLVEARQVRLGQSLYSHSIPTPKVVASSQRFLLGSPLTRLSLLLTTSYVLYRRIYAER